MVPLHCNSLHSNACLAPSLAAFKHLVKTDLFRKAIDSNLCCPVFSDDVIWLLSDVAFTFISGWKAWEFVLMLYLSILELLLAAMRGPLDHERRNVNLEINIKTTITLLRQSSCFLLSAPSVPPH